MYFHYISQKDENETTIEEILTNEKIYIRSKTQEKNNLNTIKKKPKEGSIEKETKEGLKIYLYPSVKFTDKEEIKGKILIVVDMGDGSLRVKSNCLTPFDTLSISIYNGNHEQMNGKELMIE